MGNVASICPKHANEEHNATDVHIYGIPNVVIEKPKTRKDIGLITVGMS